MTLISWLRVLLRLALLGTLSPTGCTPDDPLEEEIRSGSPYQQEPTSPPSLPERGRWREGGRPHADPAQLSAQDEIERLLAAIGYAAGTREATTDEIVTVHDAARAFEGLNLYTSGHDPAAFLTDMDGAVVHSWTKPFAEIWPEAAERGSKYSAYWRRVHVFENGDLLAIFENLALIKLDADSNLIWARRFQPHHDLEVMPNGDILVLAREAGVIPRIHPTAASIEDFILVLDSRGNEKARVSILRAFENSRYTSILERRSESGDIFHTNSLEIIDGRSADTLPAFAAGTVLISLRTLDAIAVVDLDEEKVVWAYAGSFKAQHDPTILANGNLLVFDNRWRAHRSRVVEFDAPSLGTPSGPTAPPDLTTELKIVWEYVGSRQQPFHSKTCGTAQRLPNGNTLITESDNGRAFEVTPDGQIVWEFYNPFRAGEAGKFVATLFEVVRLDRDFGRAWRRNGRPRI